MSHSKLLAIKALQIVVRIFEIVPRKIKPYVLGILCKSLAYAYMNDILRRNLLSPFIC